VQLTVQKSFKEEETWLFLRLTVLDRLFNELLGLLNLIKFYGLVDIVAIQWVGIAPNYRDSLQKIGIFVLWEQFPSLLEKLACHQVIFKIHIQNAFWQIFVVFVLSLKCADFLNFFYVF
jgi:hypothetical protein